LHIVRPEFNVGVLHPKEPATIQAQFLRISENVSRPIYANEVVHKSFDLAKIEFAVIRPNLRPHPPKPFHPHGKQASAALFPSNRSRV
jgi:hypothetical protein